MPYIYKNSTAQKKEKALTHLVNIDAETKLALKTSDYDDSMENK